MLVFLKEMFLFLCAVIVLLHACFMAQNPPSCVSLSAPCRIPGSTHDDTQHTLEDFPSRVSPHFFFGNFSSKPFRPRFNKKKILRGMVPKRT